MQKDERPQLVKDVDDALAQAASWSKPRRVIAKVELHPGELYPRVGFVVTNMSRPAERVVAFYNKRGTAEQWIKEGKGAIKWTRLSCRTFAANACVSSFMRSLTTSATSCARWRRRSRSRLVAVEPDREADQDRCQGHQPCRSIAFQMAESPFRGRCSRRFCG